MLVVDRNASLDQLLATRHPEIRLFIVSLDNAPGRELDMGSEAGREMLRQHFLYWWELEERGVLIGAGPVNPGAPEQFGMAVFAAPSRAEAEALAFAEPMHKAGWRVNTVREWQLNEGAAVPLAKKMTGR
jgi:uncharacterized protein YciI